MSAVSTDDAGTWRERLIAAGILVPLGADGLYARSGGFERIADGIEHAVIAAGADEGATRLRFPPVIPRSVFERTGYLRSFPDLLGSVHGFAGDDRDHAELLRSFDAGEDWTEGLRSSELALCSAACHPLYPIFAGTVTSGSVWEVLGFCFRNEPSLEPTRFQVFRQHEYVRIGDPDAAREHRDRWVERGLDLLSALGLDVRVDVANDPFFGRAGRLLASSQRQAALKLEILCPIDGRDVAISSGNCHGDHFGEAFDIRTPDGEHAHTACIGFGIERITLALLWTHGLDPQGWPAAVRSRLWS
jgi:seryl-tRNA synthetase